MIVEKVAPVVVHLADVAVVNTPSESNIKVTLDEKTLPLADPIHKVPVSTFQKTADVSVDKSEKADKVINVLGLKYEVTKLGTPGAYLIVIECNVGWWKETSPCCALTRATFV